MKFSRWLAVLCFVLTFATGRSEKADPKPAPPPTEIKTWRLEADVDRGTAVTLFQGETIENVIAKLGEPRRRWKKKKDPTHQELGYVRKVPGAYSKRALRHGDISTTVGSQILYIDEITLFFKNGTLQKVKTNRTRSDDPVEGLPPFMR